MNHRITVCISCRRKGTETRLGFELIERLRNALLAAEEMIPETFDVTGVACMAGCDRPCTVAYHSTSKASYLFGDIHPKTDVDDLIAFAKQYAYLGDGWCSSVDRPGKLRKSTMARIPAADSALEEQKARAS